MGTIVNYKHVCREPQMLASKESDEGADGEDTVTRFGVKLNLHHNGHLYYAEVSALELHKKLPDRDLPLRLAVSRSTPTASLAKNCGEINKRR